MLENLKEILVIGASAIAGLLGSTVFVFIAKRIVKKLIEKFLKEKIEPLANTISSDKRIEHIDNTCERIEKEILELRGKRK